MAPSGMASRLGAAASMSPSTPVASASHAGLPVEEVHRRVDVRAAVRRTRHRGHVGGVAVRAVLLAANREVGVAGIQGDEAGDERHGYVDVAGHADGGTRPVRWRDCIIGQ